MKVLVDAYRALHMDDLATNADRVYAANYPAGSGTVAARKPWWKFF
jgi:outer membrane protein assembly factor BamD (BamD/ComL family)